ncbi:MAG: zinc ABC transporter substrate-binding protein [Chloroflexota bacterium]|nr:zinc ABC transporter substrate-binding protein [Chloroflexota bacterium]
MRFHIKYAAFLAALLVVLVVGAACGETDDSDGRLSVVASIYPMGYFAERVGGDRVTVDVLIEPGMEAHGFEPTASHLRNIGAADVVVMNGLELEPWLERALEALEENAEQVVVETADASQAVEGFAHEHDEAEGEDHGEEGKEEEHEEGKDEDHEEGEDEDHQEDGEEGEEHGEELDPHMWLDPLLAVVQVERIRDALIRADADNADTYRANASTVITELNTLHGEFMEGLANCRHDHFVTSHAAYAYLGLRYSAEQIPVTGLSPEAEPSPRQLAAITDRVTELGLGYVLVEPVLSDGLAQTIAREAGIELIPFHAIGSVTDDELETHGDYFGLMRNNLASLKVALECA